MRLRGNQVQSIHDAMLSAFPDISSLRKMARFELNESLSAIAGGTDLSDVIFDLIEWAETNGRIKELIIGAYQQVPGNQQLKELIQESAQWTELQYSSQVSSRPQKRPQISLNQGLVWGGIILLLALYIIFNVVLPPSESSNTTLANIPTQTMPPKATPTPIDTPTPNQNDNLDSSACLEDANNYYQQGIELFHQGKNGRALDEFKEARNCDLETADLYYHMGVACHNLKYHDEGCSYEEAINYYDEAIRIDDEVAGYYADRAWSYRHLNEPDLVENRKKAISDWSEAFKLDEKLEGARPIWYAYRMDVYRELLDLGFKEMKDNAAKDCEMFLQLTSSNPDHKAWVDWRDSVTC